ncbi:MAG: type I restriction enzyme HsdR N-terminal domain-containing protein [Bacteroidales bacterium]|nr:type I restriction enzyme HsdR N-terminal domain-containing protein [Candidatus Colicola coprequi]
MSYRTKQIRGKEYIFCDWRRKYVRLTPEEWVRQQFLHYLVEQLRYPSSLIAVEIALSTGRRADAVVYSKQLVPLVIIEFKADSVALTQDTLDQAAAYNRQLQVPYLILHNGINTIVGKIVPAINTPSAENIPIQNHTIEFLDNIPSYSSLIS